MASFHRVFLICCIASAAVSSAQLPAGIPPDIAQRAQSSPLRQHFLPPTRIVWKSDSGVENAESLLGPKAGQAVLSEPAPPCRLKSVPGKSAAVVLDFGIELNGNVELFTPMTADKVPAPIRIRFGESVAEAMSDVGQKGAENDHAVRDQTVTLPWLGRKSVGPSGFRFVRIDAADPAHPVSLSQVRAVLVLRDLPYVGSFRCDDERLNRIWMTGAYTVHLAMQDYLWDGIKRDRLVWLGDMHPEVRTINAVFGFTDVVPRSLDLIRDVTPPTQWMNGISSYSMWWVLIQEDWWLHHGRRDYLDAQKPYLAALLRRLATMIDEHGSEKLDGQRFLDWPTSENKPAIHAGLQGLFLMTMESGERLSKTLDDNETAHVCAEAAQKLRRHIPAMGEAKQAAALLALAGLKDAREVSEHVLEPGGPHGLSTFYGYYVLEALARAGKIDTALDFISHYWGGMLDFGATTFWEDFDLAWTENAGRIDQIVPAGKKDLHGDFGAYCYVGFRHSLCHGWASGPTAWLSQHVLGITPLAPGCARVRIAPQLGKLRWAEGSYPTPQGAIKVRHERKPDGSISSQIDAPKGVEIVRE